LNTIWDMRCETNSDRFQIKTRSSRSGFYVWS
jgi:hypothetical protein